MTPVISIAEKALYLSRGRDGGPANIAGTSAQAVLALKPAPPLYIYRPRQATADAKAFLSAFPGETMYAVKVNTDPVIIRAIHKSGVRSFDAASIEEVRLIRSIAPKAKLYFMHPVKPREAIREAYSVHGVRAFVLDHETELNKILEETGNAEDLELFVRLSLPKNGSAAIDFSSKFGASFDEAVSLLHRCRDLTKTLGISFHVGTQTLDAEAYGRAVHYSALVIRESGVTVDKIDVGGGFAVSAYCGEEDAPSVESCVESLTKALKNNNLDKIPLLAEPGRNLVARSGSLVVRVELRKGNILYINDGTYGGLFDAGKILNVRYPVNAVRAAGDFVAETAGFAFTGPTCDSIDTMNGPFTLPADIREGDWIEIQTVGAYSRDLRSNFNGFGKSDVVYLR